MHTGCTHVRQEKQRSGWLTMNLSASALIRPLLRHVFQILGSTKPIRRVPKLPLILKDLCGANSSVSLLCGTIIASMRATRSFADFACDTRLDSVLGVVRVTYHATHGVESLAEIEDAVHRYLTNCRLQRIQRRAIRRCDERSYRVCTDSERAESRGNCHCRSGRRTTRR
jgi:hypothetical protein